MKTDNGPATSYELVYRFWPRPIHALKDDGFYHKVGRARGVLVRSYGMMPDMYHLPAEMLAWKCKLSLRERRDLLKEGAGA